MHPTDCGGDWWWRLVLAGGDVRWQVRHGATDCRPITAVIAPVNRARPSCHEDQPRPGRVMSFAKEFTLREIT